MRPRIFVHQHAQDISSAEWSRLSVNRDARLDQRWFLLNQPDIPSASRYLSVWSQDRLQALAPCIVSHAQSSSFVPHRPCDALFHSARVAGPDVVADDPALAIARRALARVSVVPAIAVTAPCAAYVPIDDLLCGANGEHDVIDDTLDAMEVLAQSVSARLSAIMGVRRSSPVFSRAVSAGFLPALIIADTLLRVSWTSMGEYLDYAGPKRLAELRRVRHKGVELRVERATEDVVDELARCAVSQLATFELAGDAYTERSYFCETGRLFGPAYRCIVARRRGEVIAFCSLLSNGASHKALDLCIDRGKAAQSGSLFPAFMCEAINQVITQGGGTISFGPTGYRDKLRSGCVLEPLWALYQPRNSSLRAALSEYLSVHNRVHTAAFEKLSSSASSARE